MLQWDESQLSGLSAQRLPPRSRYLRDTKNPEPWQLLTSFCVFEALKISKVTTRAATPAQSRARCECSPALWSSIDCKSNLKAGTGQALPPTQAGGPSPRPCAFTVWSLVSFQRIMLGLCLVEEAQPIPRISC